MLTDAVSRAVLVSAPEGLFVFDREGHIVFANSQFEELFGYAPGELLGQSSDLLIPDLFQGERQRQSRDSVPALPTPRLGLKVKGCIVRKFASLERQDHTLGELNDHFRQMVENSHDILCIRDADTRVRYASPSFQHVMGYKQEEIIGSTGFDLIHPEDRSAVESAVTEFWKTPGARDSIQYRAKHANGSWVSLEVVAYNLLDHPVIQGVVINGRDISRRKHEEDSKDQLIAELQQTLANIKSLTGVLPICASCKKVQEGDKWQQIEAYIRDRSQLEFSHTMCPECTTLWYPELQGR